VVAWWLLIAVLGWVTLPLARLALPGFEVGAYALSRTLGMLLLAWGTWFLASARFSFRPATILAVLLLMALVAAGLAYRDRARLGAFLRERRREIVWVEALVLGLFLLDLAIRLGNPDLWHPYKGGEKPMDFSYFNAILRSTSFPPYDPWFAGGYINYYYFGFVLVGVPVRLLGLNPAVAYNLILPTLFALLGINGYALGFELVRRATGFVRSLSPRLAGGAAAAFLVLMGNLGTVVMGYQGLKRIGAEGQPTAELLAGIPQAARGLIRFVSLKSPLPYRMDEWYWNPSRAIPSAPGDVDPITEFPFFTFLYADLHAHMMALPLTVLALAWAASWLLAADEKKKLGPAAKGAALIVGGLVIGSLQPTNTWDFPVYLTVGLLAAAAAPFVREGRWGWAAAGEALLTTGVLLASTLSLFAPYTQWYVREYSSADLWEGSRTSLRGYLTVHGVFLFFTGVWMAWETVAWMASTPISALARLRPYRIVILGLGILASAVILYAAVQGVRVTVLAGPLMIWGAILFFRPNWPLAKRLALAMVLIGLALTLVVEVVVLRGDIGRMNTVFKFYLEVWTLFSIAAASGLFWSLAETPAWHPVARAAWTIGGAALIGGALLFPLTATQAKIRDRISPEAPHSLDGLAFMASSTYADMGRDLHLDADYRMIQWLQDNVEGSPPIVEAHAEQYRWGARTAIYTGLPSVLGWSWHQQQQRAGDSTAVLERASEIADFYTRFTVDEARDFLQRYGVRYIIVGEMERAYYEEMQPCWPAEDSPGVSCDMAGRPLVTKPPLVTPDECVPIDPAVPDGARRCPTHGLEKFSTMVADGTLREAYRDGDTVIYEVVE
jgi:YYY domain-containing protein